MLQADKSHHASYCWWGDQIMCWRTHALWHLQQPAYCSSNIMLYKNSESLVSFIAALLTVNITHSVTYRLSYRYGMHVSPSCQGFPTSFWPSSWSTCLWAHRIVPVRVCPQVLVYLPAHQRYQWLAGRQPPSPRSMKTVRLYPYRGLTFCHPGSRLPFLAIILMRTLYTHNLAGYEASADQ